MNGQMSGRRECASGSPPSRSKEVTTEVTKVSALRLRSGQGGSPGEALATDNTDKHGAEKHPQIAQKAAPAVYAFFRGASSATLICEICG